MVDDSYNNTYEIVKNCFHWQACIIYTVEKKNHAKGMRSPS